MRPLKENSSIPNSSQKQTSKLIQQKLGLGAQLNDSFSNKGSLNELENQLQYLSKVRNYTSKLELKENIPKTHTESSLKLPIPDRLTQTGNFGHPESELTCRASTQRTLPAFIFDEDLPDIADLVRLQNCIIDTTHLPVEYMDELRRLASIIMFRIRNTAKPEF